MISQRGGSTVLEEVINARNVDALGELLTPHGVDLTLRPPDHRAGQAVLRDGPPGLPDLHAEVHDVIAEGT
jgi:hypothetical protein